MNQKRGYLLNNEGISKSLDQLVGVRIPVPQFSKLRNSGNLRLQTSQVFNFPCLDLMYVLTVFRRPIRLLLLGLD
jgi:hypothetical protein